MTYFIAKRQLFGSMGASKVLKNCDFGQKNNIFSNFRGKKESIRFESRGTNGHILKTNY